MQSSKKHMPLLLTLCYQDIVVRYRRSILGPFWLILSTTISAVGLGYVWSIISHQDKHTFIPRLCIGLIIWQFLSSCILESAGCFTREKSIIYNIPKPIMLHTVAVVIRNFIVFLHGLTVILVICLLYPPEITVYSLMIIPNILLVLVSLCLAATVIAFIGVRYRDFEPALQSSMTLIFFFTPVMFKPAQLGSAAKLAWLNPFTYLVTLMRSPLNGQPCPLFVYVVTVSLVLIGATISYQLIKRLSHRVVYWL